MYYIDGNNLAGTHPTIELESPTMRKDVLELVREWAQRHNKSVTIAFDGHVKGETHHVMDNAVRIIYPSTNDINADEALVRAIAADSDRGNAVLVTNDRGLQRAARQAGVGVIMTCDVFLQQIESERRLESRSSAEEKPASPRSKEEVEDWVDFFRQGGVDITDEPIIPLVDKKYLADGKGHHSVDHRHSSPEKRHSTAGKKYTKK